MIVENYKEKKEKNDVSDCLYKQFGNGVFLIKGRYGGELELMIICSGNQDILIIGEHNDIRFISSNNGTIVYKDFDKYYSFIKKLSTNELVVRLQKEGVDE